MSDAGKTPARPPPPPLPGEGKDRRTSPRYEVVAQASVVSGEEVHLLTARNISFSGVFLEGKPSDYPELRRGSKIDLVLSASDPEAQDDEVLEIRCAGTIVRLDPGTGDARPPGFGVTIAPGDDEQQDRLNRLLIVLARGGKLVP